MKQEQIEALGALVASGSTPAGWGGTEDALVIEALPKLLAEREALLKALRAVEHGSSEATCPGCPRCSACLETPEEEERHRASDCQLATAIRLAES